MKRALLILFVFLPACGLLGTGDDAGPSGKIVFSAVELQSDEQANIFTIRPDGSELTLLTDWEYASGDPVWSPDGSQVLFGSGNQATTDGSALWIMNEDGSKKYPLKDSPEPHHFPLSGEEPTWSPNGEKIAFHLCLSCSAGTNYEIYVFNTVTEEVHQLTDHPANDTHPSWSPDGSRIVFSSDREYYDADTLQYREDLYTISVIGSKVNRLTTVGYADQPVWNPDGTTIAYRSTDPSLGLYQVNIQTGTIDKIWDIIGEDIVLLYPMTWSEDGTKLLITARPRRSNDGESMYILDMETNEATRIPYNPTTILGADWYTNENE